MPLRRSSRLAGKPVPFPACSTLNQTKSERAAFLRQERKLERDIALLTYDVCDHLNWLPEEYFIEDLAVQHIVATMIGNRLLVPRDKISDRSVCAADLRSGRWAECGATLMLSGSPPPPSTKSFISSCSPEPFQTMSVVESPPIDVLSDSDDGVLLSNPTRPSASVHSVEPYITIVNPEPIYILSDSDDAALLPKPIRPSASVHSVEPKITIVNSESIYILSDSDDGALLPKPTRLSANVHSVEHNITTVNPESTGNKIWRPGRSPHIPAHSFTKYVTRFDSDSPAPETSSESDRNSGSRYTGSSGDAASRFDPDSPTTETSSESDGNSGSRYTGSSGGAASSTTETNSESGRDSASRFTGSSGDAALSSSLECNAGSSTLSVTSQLEDRYSQSRLRMRSRDSRLRSNPRHRNPQDYEEIVSKPSHGRLKLRAKRHRNPPSFRRHRMAPAARSLPSHRALRLKSSPGCSPTPSSYTRFRETPWLFAGETIFIRPPPSSTHGYDLAVCAVTTTDRDWFAPIAVRMMSFRSRTRRGATYFLPAITPVCTKSVADTMDNLVENERRIIKIEWDARDVTEERLGKSFVLDGELDAAYLELAHRELGESERPMTNISREDEGMSSSCKTLSHFASNFVQTGIPRMSL
ncbi:hypothetical protein HDU86_005489 [Geranomyces michiganensis]|nr:hypothetical protein HDU86_005489 [Geranomyces michiganensis]